jgi:transposase
MTKRIRRNFTLEQTVVILRQHLIDHKPVSDVCEFQDLQPTSSIPGQFSENGAAAFKKTSKSSSKNPLETKFQKLEHKIAGKDEVIAEIAEMCVQLKRDLGESDRTGSE